MSEPGEPIQAEETVDTKEVISPEDGTTEKRIRLTRGDDETPGGGMRTIKAGEGRNITLPAQHIHFPKPSTRQIQVKPPPLKITSPPRNITVSHGTPVCVRCQRPLGITVRHDGKSFPGLSCIKVDQGMAQYIIIDSGRPKERTTYRETCLRAHCQNCGAPIDLLFVGWRGPPNVNPIEPASQTRAGSRLKKFFEEVAK